MGPWAGIAIILGAFVLLWSALATYRKLAIPILILTLADAIAALVGMAYGAHRYTGIAGQKSAEGSLAFFTVAFLTTHIPLLLLTTDQQMAREKVLLISLTIGFLVMLMEGI